ncbi:MAG: cellulase family glycosylhydrolase [Capsulimonadaceae bacterium]|nr:cellulase family glycosylhydrolase [Capsulimonadaceae bacterium]
MTTGIRKYAQLATTAPMKPAERLRTHRFGANYVPSRNWWYCWNDFDKRAIARDFDRIASIGMDHIRIMLLWPYFQPNPTSVSSAHLDRLDSLMTLAEARGLDVCVTALNGFLSGYHFEPPYCVGKSIYTDATAIAAQERFFQALAALTGRHPNFLGFDLGNEICCYRQAELAVGDAWQGHMLGLLRQISPDGVHVNGVDHQPWFRPNTFSPKALTAGQQIVPIHCWTYFTGALDRGGALGSPSVNLLAGMAALVRAYAGDPDKPVWVQEYGASLEWMDAPTLATWTERATLAAIEQGVSWMTWWCSHDIDPGYEFASLEYGLGLFTTSNQPKAHTEVIREIIDAYSGKPVVIPPPTRALPPLPAEATIESTWQWLEDWAK